MDITALCSGKLLAADERAAAIAFVQATNAHELETLAALFADDALVNDQLRNFWGRDAITSWLAREIVGEKIELEARKVGKHYGVVMVNAEIRGDFEAPRVARPMVVDLHFTVRDARIVRLLVLLERADAPEPEIRRIP